MKNFATKNQKELIKKLKVHRLNEQKELDKKIGITRQFIRENIEGIDKAIKIIQKSLKKIKRFYEINILCEIHLIQKNHPNININLNTKHNGKNFRKIEFSSFDTYQAKNEKQRRRGI
jgi:hypothetical protein